MTRGDGTRISADGLNLVILTMIITMIHAMILAIILAMVVSTILAKIGGKGADSETIGGAAEEEEAITL